MEKRKQVRRSWGKAWPGLLVGLLLFIIGLLLPDNAVRADEPTPTPLFRRPVEWTTVTVETATDLQNQERPPTQNPKLDSSLNQLLEAHRNRGSVEAEGLAQTRRMALEDNRVQVEFIVAQETMNDLIAAIEAIGGAYQGHYQTLAQAIVPIEALESLAQRPDVQVIRNPIRAVPVEPVLVGAVNTEGMGPTHASAWHASGFTGVGVKIAVIDVGFQNYTSLLGSDLPVSVTARDYTDTGMGGNPHGTACAEVVHDMAPGATLYLSKVSSIVELSTAVNDLIAAKINVISMSLRWPLDGPGDGTGYLASIVANARTNGILFVTAAGNEAEVSWSGFFDDDGSGNHLWASGQITNYFGSGHTASCYVFPADYPISVYLHWDDWTSVDQDYDLKLYRWTGSAWSLVMGSYNRQAESYPTPEEFIQIDAPYSACYGVRVIRYSATRNVCLSLRAINMEHLDEWVPERSLGFPADSPNAVTVGAVNVSSPYSLESYSSQGPTFGPGGTCSGGSTKPNLVGYANVSTISYGSGDFNGTSAATPHVAGAAALVKGAYPGYSVSQLQSHLENNALDLGASGKDNLYGAGRLYLGDPPASPELKVYLPLVVKNYSPGLPPTPPSSLYGSVLRLAGTDDYAVAADSADLDVGDEAGESLTIEAWFYDPGQPRLGAIISKDQSYKLRAYRYYSGITEVSCVGFDLAPPEGQFWGFFACESPPYARGWHHVAGVFYKDSGQMRIYRDGKALGNETYFGPTINNSVESLKVGVNLGGAVEEVRISDMTRYTGSSYNVPTSPFTCDAHTRALWHFDEAAGATTFSDGEDGTGRNCGNMEDKLTGLNGAISGP